MCVHAKTPSPRSACNAYAEIAQHACSLHAICRCLAAWFMIRKKKTSLVHRLFSFSSPSASFLSVCSRRQLLVGPRTLRGPCTAGHQAAHQGSLPETNGTHLIHFDVVQDTQRLGAAFPKIHHLRWGVVGAPPSFQCLRRPSVPHLCYSSLVPPSRHSIHAVAR